MSAKPRISRSLEKWSFTQVGGGEGTEDGEWLEVSSFPTTVHVELLKLGRIPDPVRRNLIHLTRLDADGRFGYSLSDYTNGTFNVSEWATSRLKVDVLIILSI